jgi:monoamine oxidase
MSRTPLFAAVQKALALSIRENNLVLPRTSALTRRRLLRLTAAAAGATALSPVLDWSARAANKTPPSIAIIGGGVAGLTAAYRLQKLGAKPVLFEASNRWGGRMLTIYDFYKGMFCELGGEFVDTDQTEIQDLCKEFGIKMQRLDVAGGEDLYFFGGKWYMRKDMLDPKKRTGAFVPIAKQIAKDAGQLTDKNDEWTDHAHKLDQMSLKTYLDQFRGKTDDWAIDLLDVAYVGEFGLETENQSSLNMVDFIGTDLKKPFKIFGDSDQVFRIKGGSSALINALLAALKDKADMRLGHSLTALDAQDGKIAMTFDSPGGTSSESFETVILTLPFTKLREVKGLESLNLEQTKLQAIRELSYGTNAKLFTGTKTRVWQSKDSGLPARSDGYFYVDLGFQNIWDQSANQPGEAGILTDFLGGKAGLADEAAARKILNDGVAKMAPKIAESFDPSATAAFFWATYPYTLGSYASAGVGQYTTYLDVAADPALDGRVQFAGEHTSSEWLGYMNGGVQSGDRAARALIKQFGLKKQKQK